MAFMLLFQMHPVFFMLVINNSAPFDVFRIILCHFAEFLGPVLAVISCAKFKSNFQNLLHRTHPEVK